MSKFQEYSFLCIAFILGLTSLFGNTLSFILIPLTAINIYKSTPSFCRQIKKEWFYIGMPLMFCLYILLLFIIQHYILGYDAKASFSIFERVFLFFFAIPLYILSTKPYMNKQLLERALLLFSGGVFFFNTCLFFAQSGFGIFTNPIGTIEEMYMTRFGENKIDLLWNSYMMLEPQSMVIALASLSALFMLIIKSKIYIAFMVLGLLLFLSFTLTKAAIIGFLLGCSTIAWFACRKISNKYKLWFSISIFTIISLFIVYTPEGVDKRIKDTREELIHIKRGETVEGSISPRIILWKHTLEHIDEYALFGKGVYSKDILVHWYTSLPNSVVHRNNTHNSFLEYWIIGGVFGLLLIMFYFILPIVRMLRLRAISLFVLGSLCIIFITSNTCVLFSHSNSLGVIMFWLSTYYLYMREFIDLE